MTTGMAVDIAEQPEVYARLHEWSRAREIARVAARVAARSPRHAVLAAPGPAAAAARYAAYLLEIRLGLATGFAPAGAITVFDARPELSEALVIGIGGSGDPADDADEQVEVLRVARERGALTVAVTHQPDGPLAQVAEVVVDTAAGPPRAVATTKVYTAAIFALLMLLEGVRAGDGELPPEERAALAVLPELAALALADPVAASAAPRYRSATRIITSGCGYGEATAGQAARTLMETSYVAALACSGAELRAGPLAITDPTVPVLAVVGAGPGGRVMRAALAQLGERPGDLLAVAPSPVPGVVAQMRVPLLEERHAPLLDILPLQQFALALALTRTGSAAPI